MKRSTIYAFILCAVVAAACGTSNVCAAPADSQQYTTSAANAEASNSIANALASANRLVRDGKYITADSDGSGSSPINPGLKSLWDMLRGLRCAVWGNCVGVDMRTLKALHIDGTGGATTTAAPAGALRMSSSKSCGALPCPTVVWGDFHKESATFAGGSLMGDGTWIGGVNVKTASRLALGKYQITCNGVTGNLLRTRFWVTPSGSDANPRFGQIHNLSIGTGDLVFEVYIFNGTTGALDDSKFFFGVDGG